MTASADNAVLDILSQKPDSGLLCVMLLARFHQIPSSRDGLRHEHGQPGESFGHLEVLKALKALGLKAKAVKSAKKRLNKLPLPAIIPSAKEGGFQILAKAEGGKVLLHDPTEAKPEVMDTEVFLEQWDGSVILAATRGKDPTGGKFDITWFIPAVIRYRKLFSEVLYASFFLQVFALISPLFFQVIIDKVLVHRGLTTLDVLALGMLVVALFEMFLGGLRTYLLSHTTNRIDVELGAKLYRHLMNLPMSFFGSRRVGDSVARVRELENIRNFITGSAMTVAIDIPFTFVFVAVMFWYSPTLTYVVVGAIPFYILLSVFVSPILRKRVEEKFARGAENQSFLVESVTGVQTVKASALEPQMGRRWDEQLAAYVHTSFRVTNLGNWASQIAGLINKITTLLILWFGAHLVIDGSLTVGQLVAINMLSGRVSGPILRLVQLWQDYQQAGVSIRRLGDILNTPSEATSDPSRAALPNLKGRVTLERINFRYDPESPEVIRELSLDIRPGEVIGIVGPSGSGKSTVTKLVQRLYTPERGRVLVDGVDLGQVDPAWLRRQVGVVLQENFLFKRSVRENIAIGDPGIPMERVIAAAKLAGAEEFISELKQGYETELDEHGGNLSGGQRQRIAIARALVSDPRILIFDEATSALDYESEKIIQENMRSICQGRTVIIIAHRLSAVRGCNRIMVMDKGVIMEEGGYAELLQKKGWFARMHYHQSGMGAVAQAINTGKKEA
ncbi:type I secretion system ATPase [Magnetococcus marinus MC-1]|uniref:Type I secretion system ATPase n=1 Tax=Magnetococcus marinus (strain ATCC BAA-1437 / JCM 17883 / MC-1) TaxID=156889 RepID=A0L933_MAGMM|nr:type I secretion system permease/ATPase [Magnetococcus marinus]ABK44476.1 type I secretion system ATPase [Magnetococcus marinus MC-1]